MNTRITQPLYIVFLNSVQPAVAVGELLQVDIVLNRKLEQGESVYLWLERTDSGSEQVISEVHLGQQSILIQQEEWLKFTPDKAAAYYQLSLATLSTASDSQLELLVTTNNPLLRTVGQSDIHRVNLQIQKNSAKTDTNLVRLTDRRSGQVYRMPAFAKFEFTQHALPLTTRATILFTKLDEIDIATDSVDVEIYPSGRKETFKTLHNRQLTLPEGTTNFIITVHPRNTLPSPKYDNRVTMQVTVGQQTDTRIVNFSQMGPISMDTPRIESMEAVPTVARPGETVRINIKPANAGIYGSCVLACHLTGDSVIKNAPFSLYGFENSLIATSDFPAVIADMKFAQSTNPMWFDVQISPDAKSTQTGGLTCMLYTPSYRVEYELNIPIKSPSLMISSLPLEVTGETGDILIFPITLNRTPESGDSLYFKLTNSQGQAVSSLDLNNIQLAVSGSNNGEKVNLSNHAGAHALTNLSSTQLELRIPVIKDVTAESKFTLQVNVGATENSSSAKWATGVIAVKEVFKVVGMQGVSRVEEASVTGTLSGSPSESAGVTLYYRITLIGFTQEEQGATRVTYRNSLDIRGLERQSTLVGFIHVNQHEQWAPVFTIRVPGMSNDKPVRVELSTSPSFEPSQTKEITVSVQKRPDADALVINRLSASVSATAGKMLAFNMTLNRIPNENESLYFKLINSQGGDALELLNLNDAELIAPEIRVKEQVSLTDHAGAHNLSNLKSTSLRFRVPVIWETTEERTLTLQVNVGDTENSSSAKWATGVILP